MSGFSFCGFCDGFEGAKVYGCEYVHIKKMGNNVGGLDGVYWLAIFGHILY